MKHLYPRQQFYYKSFLLFILFNISSQVFSQNAGISATGSIPPDNSAGLDINFPSLGLLIPRIALTSTSSFAPLAAHVAGMIVYNTSGTADVTPGFYINNGTKWISALPKAVSAGDMMYWDGTTWVPVPAGQPGQLLQLNNSGIPVWTGGGYATLSTTVISGLTSVSASTGGNISSDGGNAVQARGVCWATTPNPTVLNNKTVDGSGMGTFTSSITGLTTGTIYYLRAYATNTTGTSYGNLVVFTTP
jgi:hypothetical protein